MSEDDRVSDRVHLTDEGALYNAAFLGGLISVAAYDYEERRGSPIPWYLVFLVLPLVLAAPVRAGLPQRANAYMSNWIRSSPVALLDVVPRARALAPYVREGIRFGLRHGLITIADDGLHGNVSRSVLANQMAGEAREIVRASALVGRWFATEEPAQVFAHFGVRP